MEQLHTVKREAEVRRHVRDERQAQEEAELAEALRLVEEFEREEATKAHLLRLERERVRRAQREKELRERARREEERRKACEVKFHGLRQELDNLHERQRVDVVREHGKEESVLQYKAEATRVSLQEQNAAEREVLVSDGKKRLLDFMSTVDDEYAARVKQERQIEDDFHQQLGAYWTGKTDGDAQVEAALVSLKRRMDKRHRAWSKWARNEVETHHFLMREEQAIQLELMQEAEKRLARENNQQRQAFVSRKQAELKWADLLVQERETMLNDLEVDEIEDGDDIGALVAELDSGDVFTDDDLEEYQVPGAFR
jgi:hypothetical protein